MLQAMGLQRVEHELVTEQQQIERLLPCPQYNPSLAASFPVILSKLISLRLILLTFKMGVKTPCHMAMIRIQLPHVGKDLGGFPGGSDSKESACNAGDPDFQSLGQDHPLEEGMATHSSILAWRIS